MNSAYPLVIYKQDDKPLPEFEDVVNGLLVSNVVKTMHFSAFRFSF